MNKVQLSNEELKSTLGPELYRLAHEKGTEAPGSGKYAYSKETGTYNCVVCGKALFASDTKFDSGTGWPSFDKPVSPEALEYETDDSFRIVRTEIRCAKCGSHLGHVFNDGRTATGKRYCLNSVCLNLQSKT